MLGFKSVFSARAIIGGIEMIHMMQKGASEVCLQSRPFACGAVREACRMSTYRSHWHLSCRLPEIATEPARSRPLIEIVRRQFPHRLVNV